MVDCFIVPLVSPFFPSIFRRIGFLVATLFECRGYGTIAFACQGNWESHCAKPLNCIGFYINISSKELPEEYCIVAETPCCSLYRWGEKKEAREKRKEGEVEVEWRWSIFLIPSATEEDLRWLLVCILHDSLRSTDYDTSVFSCSWAFSLYLPWWKKFPSMRRITSCDFANCVFYTRNWVFKYFIKMLRLLKYFTKY